MTQMEQQLDSPGRPRLFVLLVAGVWLGLAVAESVHRLAPFIHPPGRNPSGAPAPYRPLAHARLVGDAGGDLTRMLGFRAGAGLFGVPRADIDVKADRFGFRNEPRLADTYCPVVVTGDSYMDQGVTNDATPAGQLSRALGVPVYDRTYMARGPWTGAREFLRADRFEQRPPKVLVWGFVERSVRAGGFREPKPKPVPPPGAWWERLRREANAFPGIARDTLRKGSMLKRWAVNVRAETVYRLTGEFLPGVREKVLLGTGPDGFPLFLAGGVQSLAFTAKRRGLPVVVKAIETVHAECERRGIHLLVLLVPDKGHVYAHALRPEERPTLPAPDALTDLAARLDGRGIHVVNLLPVFLARNGDGDPPLYYPDDTHWNEYGIRIAMETVAASLSKGRHAED
ncbi:hypothetical protein HQ560_09195 [bacterium]|nr:hypothetical protein [bacterium]